MTFKKFEISFENLKEGNIDISLTYEEKPELAAIKEGWAIDRTLVFNDHFILIGPKSNPAKITKKDTIQTAFSKISKSGSLFFSRNDLSGTNERERTIWEALNLKPWISQPTWYITEKLFPSDSLKKSDRKGLYTLTDRGTLLALQNELINTGVYIQRC